MYPVNPMNVAIYQLERFGNPNRPIASQRNSFPRNRISTDRSVRVSEGFTLIEVLVTIVVMSLGLLGLIALQGRSLDSSHSAYLASIASIQAMSFQELVRANTSALDSYKDANLDAIVDKLPTDCDSSNTTGCNPEQLANYDVARWLHVTRKLFPSTLSVTFKETAPRMLDLSMSWQTPHRETGSAGSSPPDESRKFEYLFVTGPSQ